MGHPVRILRTAWVVHAVVRARIAGNAIPVRIDSPVARRVNRRYRHASASFTRRLSRRTYWLAVDPFARSWFQLGVPGLCQLVRSIDFPLLPEPVEVLRSLRLMCNCIVIDRLSCATQVALAISSYIRRDVAFCRLLSRPRHLAIATVKRFSFSSSRSRLPVSIIGGCIRAGPVEVVIRSSSATGVRT